MKESQLSRTSLTAKDAQKITATAQKYGARTKAEQILLKVHKVIREQASQGATSVSFDLLAEGGLKGLPMAEEIRDLIVQSLTGGGFTLGLYGDSVQQNCGYKWHLKISWGE